MEKVLGVYFSGSGNTHYCLDRLLKSLGLEYELVSIEDTSVRQKINDYQIIYFGNPIQFSNCPLIVRTFIRTNYDLWKDKKILCLTTMGLFSGDGSGVTARLFRKYKAKIIGGIHLKMPDAVADKKVLIKPFEKNVQEIMNANKLIDKYAEMIKNGHYPQKGLTIFSHILGLFGQRLWMKNYHKEVSKNLKINDSKCIKCNLCINNCPTHNLEVINGKVQGLNKCSLCYRCVNHCPKQAITILGTEVIEQIKIEKYLK